MAKKPTPSPEVISWTAIENSNYPKSAYWYLSLSLIAILLAGWAVFTKNFLFAFIVGTSYFSLIIYSIRKPESIKVSISSKGIKVGSFLYRFSDLKSFWIFYEPPVREISLRGKRRTTPYIKVPLSENINPSFIRKALLSYLPEKKHRESVMENLARQLGF